MKAKLSQYQQSPRKVRLVADSVRGLPLDKALVKLEFMPKRAAKALHKLLSSALANSGDSAKPSEFRIETIMVDEGPRYRRFKPGFRGRSDRFYRRTSHVHVALEKINNAVE